MRRWRWWWWCWLKGVLPKDLIHAGCSHKRGLPKSTHAPTAEFAWSQHEPLLWKHSKKSHKKERDLCTQCPFQEVRGNLARHRNSLIWHLTSKGTMGTSIGTVMMIDEGSGATMGIESPILGSLTMNRRLIHNSWKIASLSDLPRAFSRKS